MIEAIEAIPMVEAIEAIAAIAVAITELGGKEVIEYQSVVAGDSCQAIAND